MSGKIKSTAAVRRSRAVGWTSTSISDWQRGRVAAAGGDPNVVPNQPFRFLRIHEVKLLTGLSRSSLYRMCAEKKFPAPIPLSSGQLGGAR
jgi:predicted DNA-binding transcriptional regulator AlpA